MTVSPPHSEAINYLWEQLHKLEPSSQDGGDFANKPGYHNTRKANDPKNYSVVDEPDKEGPDNLAAAFDWTFPEAQSGSYDRIIKYSKRLLDCGKDENDSRLDWMREFYGQADKDTQVEGWDFRYAVTASSDPSHLWHIHFSFSRNALTIANMDKLLEVLKGDDDMNAKETAVAVLTTDGIIDNKYFTTRPDSPGHVPPGSNEFITLETAVIEAYTVGRNAAAEGVEANAKLDQVLAGGATVIVGPELLKEVMLDPMVVETYAKAIAEKIVGINFEVVG